LAAQEDCPPKLTDGDIQADKAMLANHDIGVTQIAHRGTVRESAGLEVRGSVHLSRQFLEKLTESAIIKVALQLATTHRRDQAHADEKRARGPASASDSMEPSQVRTRLSAGGRWIRTIGPCREGAGYIAEGEFARGSTGGQKNLAGYRWFESISLQR
jgi:hypothetical protein